MSFRSRVGRGLLASLAASALMFGAGACVPDPPPSCPTLVSGFWEGTTEIFGLDLELTEYLSVSGNSVSGTIEVEGREPFDIAGSVDCASITATTSSGDVFEATLSADGSTQTGTTEFLGQSGTFTLTRCPSFDGEWEGHVDGWETSMGYPTNLFAALLMDIETSGDSFTGTADSPNAVLAGFLADISGTAGCRTVSGASASGVLTFNGEWSDEYQLYTGTFSITVGADELAAGDWAVAHP